jgi:hypothetical protein
VELGSALLLFGLDVELLQGTLNFLYQNLPPFRTVEDPAGGWRLELDQPQLETRTEGGFRLGVHLSGGLFLGDDPDARVFDTWVRLRPEVGADDEGFPVGTLRFDGVEEVVPALAEQAVANAFGPEGPIGSALDALSLDVFRSLLEGAQEQLVGGGDVDLSAFSTAFYLGRPAPIPRPVWAVRREGDGYQPVLDLDISYATTPALVASVALAGADPVPPDAPSVVRPGTGLGLVTTAAVFDARFARESAAVVGTELDGLTIDRLEVRSTDYGFDVDGEGHKTGAEVDFAGSLVAQYRGGVGGELAMRSTVETDVDTAWWVDLLGVVAAVVPVIGWILGDVFIWGPEQEAPGKVEAALLENVLRAAGRHRPPGRRSLRHRRHPHQRLPGRRVVLRRQHGGGGRRLRRHAPGRGPCRQPRRGLPQPTPRTRAPPHQPAPAGHLRRGDHPHQRPHPQAVAGGPAGCRAPAHDPRPPRRAQPSGHPRHLPAQRPRRHQLQQPAGVTASMAQEIDAQADR